MKILLVDDNKDLCSMLSEVFHSFGYTVIVAHNGFDGMVKYFSDDFDLLWTDYDMPEMNGLEMIRYIRTENLEIPIILSTGRTESDFFLKTNFPFINQIVSKPVTDFVALKTLLDYHLFKIKPESTVG